MAARKLRFFDVRSNDPARPSTMVLMENDGTEVSVYRSPRWFRRIQHEGRWFLIAGADRETGELIFLPEAEVV